MADSIRCPPEGGRYKTVLGSRLRMKHRQPVNWQGRSGETTLARRDLLQRAAWIFAAAVLPCAAELAAEDVSPVMLKLSAYMSEARNSALPEKVLQETKHHILDTFAAMISGSELPPGRMALKFAQSYGGPGTCTVVASEIL